MGVLWGHTISVTLTQSTRQRELQDMLDAGANCVRINNDATLANLCRSMGFPRHSVIMGGYLQSYPNLTTFAQSCVAWAQAYPEALIEPGNEQAQNFTAAQMAALQIAVYNAIKNAGLPNPVLLSSTIEGPTGPSNLHPVDWCYALAANGCTWGTGFDWANYHGYITNSTDTASNREATWLHMWTPRSTDGKSCQDAFKVGGLYPPFAMTEFGINMAAAGGSETIKDAGDKGWMNLLLTQSKFVYGAQYTMSADAPGGDFGLRRADLTRRPSFTSYRNIAVATAQNPPTGGGTPPPPPGPTVVGWSTSVGPAAQTGSLVGWSNSVGPAVAVPTDTTPPVVALTAPTDGASVSGNVVVTANASDVGTGVRQVDFLVDGVIVGTAT